MRFPEPRIALCRLLVRLFSMLLANKQEAAPKLRAEVCVFGGNMDRLPSRFPCEPEIQVNAKSSFVLECALVPDLFKGLASIFSH